MATVQTLDKIRVSLERHIGKKILLKANKGRKQINTTQNNNTYKKTKFHNFNETFTQYTSDELDEIIKKSQKEKFK